MSLALRRYAVSAIVALVIAVVPVRLTAQNRPVASATPVGQISIGDGPAVPIYSFSFGASNPFTAGGGGGSTGRANLSDVNFMKQADALSTAMFRYVLTATHLPSVRIEVFQRGSVAVGTTFELSNVVVTSFQVSGGEAVESVSMAFGRIVLTAGGQSYCWDISANLAC